MKTQRIYTCCPDSECGQFQSVMRFLNSFGIEPSLGFNDGKHYIEFNPPRNQKKNEIFQRRLKEEIPCKSPELQEREMVEVVDNLLDQAPADFLHSQLVHCYLTALIMVVTHGREADRQSIELFRAVSELLRDFAAKRAT